MTDICFYIEMNGRKRNSLERSSREETKNDVTTNVIKRPGSNSVICYVGKLQDYPGKFLPQVAMSLGVPKGPMFGLLKNGQRVTLPCGKIVSNEIFIIVKLYNIETVLHIRLFTSLSKGSSQLPSLLAKLKINN